MKCINCNASNMLKDRIANTGRCKSCDRLFAFEPTIMPDETRFTDTFFAYVDRQSFNESRELIAIEGDDTAIIDRSNFYTVDSFG